MTDRKAPGSRPAKPRTIPTAPAVRPTFTADHLRAIPGQPVPTPADLGEAGRALWQRVCADFCFEDAASLATLAEACHALDLLELARGELRRDGVTFRDRWDQPRPNPAAQIVRDSRAGLLSCLRALGVAAAGLVPDSAEGK